MDLCFIVLSATPRCVRHYSPMDLERSELRPFGDARKIVDIYKCPVPDCAVKYSMALGGFGIFDGQETFVLIEEKK
jgi:hypothetical protein